jgi:hypothetical protein
MVFLKMLHVIEVTDRYQISTGAICSPNMLLRPDLSSIIFFMILSDVDITSSANPKKIKKSEAIFLT